MVDRLILAATGTSSDAKSEANLQGISTLSTLAKKEGLERVIQLILDIPSFVSKENPQTREKIRRIYLDNRDVFESEFALVRLWQPTQPPASGRLSEIQARTLIMEGENDSPQYKLITDQLLKIKGAKKVIIAGAAHAINLDKPKEFNEAVLKFLSES